MRSSSQIRLFLLQFQQIVHDRTKVTAFHRFQPSTLNDGHVDCQLANSHRLQITRCGNFEMLLDRWNNVWRLQLRKFFKQLQRKKQQHLKNCAILSNSINQSINQSTDQWYTNKPINQSIKRSTGSKYVPPWEQCQIPIARLSGSRPSPESIDSVCTPKWRIPIQTTTNPKPNITRLEKNSEEPHVDLHHVSRPVPHAGKWPVWPPPQSAWSGRFPRVPKTSPAAAWTGAGTFSPAPRPFLPPFPLLLLLLAIMGTKCSLQSVRQNATKKQIKETKSVIHKLMSE